MSNIGIALQLETVRHHAARDLAGTLRRVREAGFEYVQWSGMPPLAPDAIHSALHTAGLKAVGGHCTSADLETGLTATVAFWLALRVPDLSVAAPPAAAQHSPADWQAWAEALAAWSATLAAAGLRLSVRHGLAEMTPCSDTRGSVLESLLDHTLDTPLCAAFDVGWLALGGADPAEAIRPYPDRCPLLHVTDVASAATEATPVFVPMGAGTLDWQAIFDAAEEIGVEWYVYDQKTPGQDIFDDLRRSYEFLFEHA